MAAHLRSIDLLVTASSILSTPRVATAVAVHSGPSVLTNQSHGALSHGGRAEHHGHAVVDPAEPPGLRLSRHRSP